MDIQAVASLQHNNHALPNKSEAPAFTDDNQFEEEFEQAQNNLDQSDSSIQTQESNQFTDDDHDLSLEEEPFSEEELLSAEEQIEIDQLVQESIEHFGLQSGELYEPTNQQIEASGDPHSEFDRSQMLKQLQNALTKDTQENNNFLKENEQFAEQLDGEIEEALLIKKEQLENSLKDQKVHKELESTQLKSQEKSDNGLKALRNDQMVTKEAIISQTGNQEIKDALLNKKTAQKLYDQSYNITQNEQKLQEGQTSFQLNQTAGAKTASANNAVQVVNNIKIMMDQDKQNLIMKLEPEDIGKLEIKLEKQGDVVKAKFIVESSEAKQYLEQNLVAIQKSLEEQGVEFKTLNIFNNHAQDQNQSQKQDYVEQGQEKRVHQDEVVDEDTIDIVQQQNPDALLSIKI